MTPSPGRRFQTAISSAPTTSSDDELGAQMIRHGPTHDAPAERIEDDSQVEEPVAPCRHVRDVGDPQLIGHARHKCALNQIWRRLSVWIALCGVERAPTMAPANPALRIRRATRLRPHRIPIEASSAWIRGTPYVPRLTWWIVRICSISWASLWARAERSRVRQAQ